jgi:hypothetical protein
MDQPSMPPIFGGQRPFPLHINGNKLDPKGLTDFTPSLAKLPPNHQGFIPLVRILKQPFHGTVPEEVKINTSFFVWKRYFNPSLTSANNFSNSGSRWCMMGSAILRSTSEEASSAPVKIDISSHKTLL